MSSPFGLPTQKSWALKYDKSVLGLNILCDLISDIICCVRSCYTGKINASETIMHENQKKRENMEIGAYIFFT